VTHTKTGYSTLCFASVACFTLVTNCVDQDGVVHFLETVKGHVARPAAGYQQLPQFVLNGAADQWMTTQQCDGFLDQAERIRCGDRVAPGQKVGKSFEVGKRPCRIDQLRQDLAFGLADFLPAMRAFR